MMPCVVSVSCQKDFLDRQIGTFVSGEEVFASYEFTGRFLTGTYAWLPEGFNSLDGAMRASATDDAEHTREASAVQRFNNGNWSPFSNPDDQWVHYYTGIRRTNLFLEKADQVNLDNFKLNPATQLEYQHRLDDLKRWKHEARFLRACFYFELVKRYAGVPLITATLSPDENLGTIPRSSLAECIAFIVSECDAAAGGLNLFPGREPGDANASGRITKGAALTLKSRVLLYAASPLYLEPGDIGDARPADPAKWRLAADAAKAVIDLGTYSLLGNYTGLYNSISNSELILARRHAAGNDFERAHYPVGYDQGQSGTTPSQNLVDAYQTIEGKFITDPGSGYDPQNPYANRDPRLLQTVIVNNSPWKDRVVEAWTGGRDGKGVAVATKTGYYLKKHVVENLNLLTNSTAVHAWPLFRLAEIYLNYAEGLNECDPGNPDIEKYVNLVRARAGMPGLPAGLPQDEMRSRIHHERRIELAFEDHRFWDVRRWKLGPQFLEVPLRGMEITRTGSGMFFYQPVHLENRVFEPRMYWYPIPQDELIRSAGWEQNPGW